MAMCLAYFLIYIPYSGLVKGVTKGLLPGMDEPITGLALLPPVVVSISFTLIIGIFILDRYRSLSWRKIYGWWFPEFSASVILSGIATATIIVTTTLNYTFNGVSIVLALLMMRGGVLVIAPIVDLFRNRQIHINSWVALASSLIAIFIAVGIDKKIELNFLVIANVAAYLGGYLLRLNLMTKEAKTKDVKVNRSFFVSESFVAALTITIIPLIFAMIGDGEASQQLRIGVS